MGDYQAVATAEQTPEPQDSPPAPAKQEPAAQVHSTNNSPPSVRPHDKHTPKRIKLREWWTWEVLAILFALACLVAIIIILAVASGKPLSSWSSPISPNAFIGIFSTLAKAALMTPVTESISQLKWLHFKDKRRDMIDMQKFDDASRGPYGALALLWSFVRGKGTSRVTAFTTLGCVAVIVGLAVEPFTQQIISFRERLVILPEGHGEAALRVAYEYDNGKASLSGTFTPEFMDNRMQGAILAGVFNQPLNTGVYEQCSSGNCTWPTAKTLSVCSTCQNVTDSSKRSCNEPNGGISVNDMTCNYTTPGNLSLAATTGKAVSAQFFWTQLNATANTTAALKNDADGALIGHIAILRILDPDSGYGLPDRAVVDECRLHWCETTYHSTSKPANSSANAGMHITHEPLFFDYENGTLVQIPGEDRMWFNSLSTSSNTSQYRINRFDSLGADEMLKDLFTTSLGSELAFDASTPGFSIARVLYTADSIEDTFTRIATSMTGELRSGAKTRPEFGQAFGVEVYIHVQWAWFTLPALLALMVIVLLVATMLANKKSGVPTWRASVLPYMFLWKMWGVDGDGRTKVSNMEDVAKRRKVQLEKIS